MTRKTKWENKIYMDHVQNVELWACRACHARVSQCVKFWGDVGINY